jgi:hypothetical protein
MAEAGSVAEAVEQALSSEQKGAEPGELKVTVPGEEEEVKEETEEVKEEEIEEAKEEQEEESDENTDEEIAQAILEGLRTNPEATIRQLATELNISLTGKTEEPTKKAVEKEVKDIKAILKDTLDENMYAVLGESLGDALEAILKDRVESRFIEQSEKDRGRIVNDELGKLEKKDKVKPATHSKILDKMHKLANQMPPAPGLDEESLREYTRNIYSLATSGIKSSKQAIKNLEKIKKNAEDAEPASSDTSEQVTRKSPEKLNIRQAVLAATRNQRLK